MKPIDKPITTALKSRWFSLIVVSTFLIWSSGAWSQISSGTTQPRQGRSCPDGQYVGQPSPGRNRYVKDDYVWAVTREFAKRFFMPVEFVAHDLKGAEAIPYRHGKPTGQEVCEMKDGQEVCTPGRYRNNAANPDSTQHLGLIAQRMPSLSYKAAEFGDKGFSVKDFDAYVMQAANQDDWRRFA